MKRFISILVALSLAMLLCVQTASAATIGDAAESSSVLSSVMGKALCERLAQADDDDIIQVTIELRDNIDLNDVEFKAVSRAKISLTETLSLTDAENESVQLTAQALSMKLSKFRPTN